LKRLKETFPPAGTEARVDNLRRCMTMAEKCDDNSEMTLEDLVVSHSYEMLALITVLERKGILTRGEVIEVIKELGEREVPE